METRLSCDDQRKVEKLVALWRWSITRCFIKSDRAGLIIDHSINFRLNANIDGPCNLLDRQNKNVFVCKVFYCLPRRGIVEAGFFYDFHLRRLFTFAALVVCICHVIAVSVQIYIVSSA